jgi:glucokinase
VLFDGETILDDYTLATPKEKLEGFYIMIKALIDPLLEKAKQNKKQVEFIGLGIAGVLDPSGRKVLDSPNLELINGVNMVEKLSNFLGMPVIMDNDVNCFLRAEMLYGAGRKYKNAFGLTIGTGIGGAWWFGGSIYQGSHRAAGEPGEMIIDFSEKMKLEPAYHKLTQNNPASLAEEAYRGDVLAERTYGELGDYLGMAMANIANLIDPEVFIIGGGVIEASELFLGRAKKTLQENIMSSEARKKIKVLKADFGNRAGAVGASLLDI